MKITILRVIALSALLSTNGLFASPWSTNPVTNDFVAGKTKDDCKRVHNYVQKNGTTNEFTTLKDNCKSGVDKIVQNEKSRTSGNVIAPRYFGFLRTTLRDDPYFIRMLREVAFSEENPFEGQSNLFHFAEIFLDKENDPGKIFIFKSLAAVFFDNFKVILRTLYPNEVNQYVKAIKKVCNTEDGVFNYNTLCQYAKKTDEGLAATAYFLSCDQVIANRALYSSKPNHEKAYILCDEAKSLALDEKYYNGGKECIEKNVYDANNPDECIRWGEARPIYESNKCFNAEDKDNGTGKMSNTKYCGLLFKFYSKVHYMLTYHSDTFSAYNNTNTLENFYLYHFYHSAYQAVEFKEDEGFNSKVSAFIPFYFELAIAQLERENKNGLQKGLEVLSETWLPSSMNSMFPEKIQNISIDTPRFKRFYATYVGVSSAMSLPVASELEFYNQIKGEKLDDGSIGNLREFVLERFFK